MIEELAVLKAHLEAQDSNERYSKWRMKRSLAIVDRLLGTQPVDGTANHIGDANKMVSMPEPDKNAAIGVIRDELADAAFGTNYNCDDGARRLFAKLEPHLRCPMQQASTQGPKFHVTGYVEFGKDGATVHPLPSTESPDAMAIYDAMNAEWRSYTERNKNFRNDGELMWAQANAVAKLFRREISETTRQSDISQGTISETPGQPDAAGRAACYQANYCVFPVEKREEIYLTQRPFWNDVAEAAINARDAQIKEDAAIRKDVGVAGVVLSSLPSNPCTSSTKEQPVECSELRETYISMAAACRALEVAREHHEAERHAEAHSMFNVALELLLEVPQAKRTAGLDEIDALRASERESISWIRKEDFRGTPNRALLAWWWNEADKFSPELDEVLLDENGKVCGKGGCGAQFYSHIMLAGFERPDGPDHRRKSPEVKP